MGKNNIQLNFSDCIDGIDISKSVFLGQGHSGKVYLMPDNRVIKIFKNEESCVRECIILNSVKGNKHFPSVYFCSGNYIIREYVPGICLEDYIKKFGLSQRLIINLIEMILDFERLGFKRLDMRCAHIFVQQDESVKVIDPRKHYTEDVAYPEKIIGKLKKLKVYNKFNNVLKNRYPDLYNQWNGKIRYKKAA